MPEYHALLPVSQIKYYSPNNPKSNLSQPSLLGVPTEDLHLPLLLAGPFPLAVPHLLPWAHLRLQPRAKT